MFLRTTNLMIGVSILALVFAVASNVQAKDKYEFCPTGFVVGFDEKGNFLCADEVCAAPCERIIDAAGIRCDCPKTVFVTSEYVTGDLEGSSIDTGDLEGLDKADAICQGLAEAAELAGEYKAWLSDSISSPSNRFNHTVMDYIDVDGNVIAHGYADLTSPEIGYLRFLQHPIGRDEQGNTVITYVRTNTLPSGEVADSFGGHCQGWTVSDYNYYSPGGFSDAVDFKWTYEHHQLCNLDFPLYCFEQ